MGDFTFKMNWSDVMDVEDLKEDVYANGWTDEYKAKLRAMCPDAPLKPDSPDETYQKILDTLE